MVPVEMEEEEGEVMVPELLFRTKDRSAYHYTRPGTNAIQHQQVTAVGLKHVHQLSLTSTQLAARGADAVWDVLCAAVRMLKHCLFMPTYMYHTDACTAVALHLIPC